MEFEDEEDLSQLENEIISILKQRKEGILQEELGRMLNLQSKDQQLFQLNKIIQMGFMRIENNQQGKLICYYQDATEKQILQTLNQEETIIYKLIQEQKNKGIETKDIKNKSKINTNQVNKVLKKLQKNGMIKDFKHKNKKMWINYDQEPDILITGGAFFKNEQVDQELINLVYSNIIYFISQQNDKTTTKQAILQNIRNEMNKFELNENNIQQVINVLLFDDKIEEYTNSFDEKNPIYKLNPLFNYKFISKNIINQLPCGICPVIDQCTPDGFISPNNCIYFNDW